LTTPEISSLDVVGPTTDFPWQRTCVFVAQPLPYLDRQGRSVRRTSDERLEGAEIAKSLKGLKSLKNLNLGSAVR
jgi:hypothetical protein